MIIGLSGPPRAGKSEYAKFLRELGMRDLSISKTIEMYTAMFMGRNFADSEKDIEQDFLQGHTPREPRIHLGQMDQYRPDLWIVKTFELFYMGPQYDYVIESVGKQPQWDAVILWLRRNYEKTDHFIARTLVNIERPGATWSDNRTRVFEQEAECRHYFLNDGTIKDLENDAANLYLSLKAST